MDELDENERRMKRHRLESELLAMEGEVQSLGRKREAAELAVRKKKKNIEHLKIEISQEEEQMRSIDRDIMSQNNDIASLKRQIHSL